MENHKMRFSIHFPRAHRLALPVSQISPVADSIVQYGSWSMPYFGLVVKAQPNELYDEIMDGVDVNTIRADSDSTDRILLT